MKYGYLNTIRWEPFPNIPGVATSAVTNPLLKSFIETGIPRAPQSRTVRDEVIFLLRCVAEIEHALLVQYLFSIYSLDDSQAKPLDWKLTIKEIAEEEMGHLITVQNLLLAVGAEPYFDRQHLTTDPFPFQLEPFSRDALAKYVITESPVPEILPDAIRRKVAEIELIANMAVNHPCFPAPGTAAPELEIKHVAALYAWLYWLFLPSDNVVGPWTTLPVELKHVPQSGHLHFPEDYPGLDDHDRRQAKALADDWGLGGLTSEGGPIYVRPVGSTNPADRNSPLQVLFDIATQGEGPDNSANHSHFDRFFGVWNELSALPAGTTVSLPVACAPVVDSKQPGRTITHKVALEWARLFNTRYQMLVLKIWLAMSQPSGDANPTKPAERPQLISSSLGEMLFALAPIASILTHLPLKPRPADGTAPAEFAGPPFQVPDGALPTQPEKQKAALVALIDESKVRIATLRDFMTGTDPDRPTADQDNDILQRLEKLDSDLRPALG